MYSNKFVLSIIHDGHPVREFGTVGIKRIALPFDSEYKVRLKNKNNRSCTAKVFIDGKEVSKLGDFIVHAGGTVDLERFVESSLEHGKRFKFVPADHPDVDDPTSSDNGIVKVEFRLARKENGVKINISPPDYWVYPGYYPTKPWEYTPNWDGTLKTGDLTCGGEITYVNASGPVMSSEVNVAYCSSKMFRGSRASNVEDGATIEGGKSNQSFVYSSLDVESSPIILKLKIVGIKDTKQADRLIHKYCCSCGNKVKRTSRYCSECGSRL